MKDPTATRNRLLAAAAKLIQTQGSQGATLDAVASESGVSKGGLLYHFPSKKTLLMALIKEGLDDFERRLRGYMDQGQTWLEAYLKASLEPAIHSEWTSGAAGAIIADPELLEPVQQAYRAWYQQAKDLGPAAQVLLLALDGLWLHQVLGLENLTDSGALKTGLGALIGDIK